MIPLSSVLAWLYRRGTGARYSILAQEFGPEVDSALDAVVDLEIIFTYKHKKAKQDSNQMYKVRARWTKDLGLNSGQGGYRLGKFKTSNGGSSNAIREYVKTAAFKYVLALH